MSLFSKLRARNSPVLPQRGPASVHGRVATAVAAAPVSATHAGPGYVPRIGRLSNGLKEFLFQLEGIGRGHLLDLGPARQTTITFFIERGYKVYTEDLLTTWKSFLDADEQRVRELPPDADRSEMTPAARAERFLENTLRYPVDTFDAVLIWDLLDYLDSELVSRAGGANDVIGPRWRSCSGNIPHAQARGFPSLPRPGRAEPGADSGFVPICSATRVPEPRNFQPIPQVSFLQDFRGTRSAPRRPFRQVSFFNQPSSAVLQQICLVSRSYAARILHLPKNKKWLLPNPAHGSRKEL